MVCERNLGISRNRMPQVEGSVLDEFLRYLTSLKVKHLRHSVHPTKLTPVQVEINRSAVQSILEAFVAKTFNPCTSEILISFDGATRYVIDGHHRYAACFMIGQEQKVIEIQLPVRVVLWTLSHFPGVERFDLNNVIV